MKAKYRVVAMFKAWIFANDFLNNTIAEKERKYFRIVQRKNWYVVEYYLKGKP